MIKNAKSTKIRLSRENLRKLTLDEQELKAVAGAVSANCYLVTANCASVTANC